MIDNGIYRFFRQLGMVFALTGCSQVNKSDEETQLPVINYSKEDTRRSAILSSVTDSPAIKHSSTSTQTANMNIRGETQARLGTTGRQSGSTSLNVLVPLRENEDRMLFGQFGGHHRMRKNSVSAGVGQRHFGNDWGLGYNLFYDAQMSKSVYHRLGVGGELWFDHARFTANGYYGLTRNQNVDDKPGYYAEVAHGYDVNLQAWIPGYRQLSGRVKFEQYFGDSVALTKKGQDARNPYALSLGLSYAPIPMLQFDVDRVLSGQSQAENRFGVSVRYQLGVPLSLQLDPTYTASQYLRKAKHYHVVDRNNDITLSFREKPSQRAEKPVIKDPIKPKPPAATPKQPEVPPTGTPAATPKQPEVPPMGTPAATPKFPEAPAASPGGDTSPEWGTPPLDTDGPDDEEGTRERLDPDYVNVSKKGSEPYDPECNLFTEDGCQEHPKNDVEIIHVYPPSPDGMPLKAVPTQQERHGSVDETEGDEGFVIVESPAIKRDSPDEHSGFEFVDAS